MSGKESVSIITGERTEESKKATCSHLTSHRLPLVPTLCVIGFLVSVIILLVALSIRDHRTCLHPEAVPPALLVSAPCEQGWVWHWGKCYFFSHNIAEWGDSWKFCASHNASLALIDTMEELEFVQHYKDNHDYWIGLSRKDDGNPWVWTNGTLFNNMFRIEGVSPCVFLNTERISSAACYGDRKWVCNKLDRSAWKS